MVGYAVSDKRIEVATPALYADLTVEDLTRLYLEYTLSSKRKETSMIREALIGTAAGAVGTVALNVTTYADMALRGRAASSVPSQAAGQLAEKLGIDLSADGEAQDGPTAQNRKSGLGALQGYVVGLGLGAAYGGVRPRLGDVSVPLAGLGLALAAMAGSDAPTTALGVVDPTTWPASTWAMDFAFHLPYGLVTAVAYEVLSGA